MYYPSEEPVEELHVAQNQPLDENVIFTKNNCEYCDMAKFLLQAIGVRAIETKVPSEYSKEELIATIENNFLVTPKTFPQIIVNNNYVGGYDDLLKELLENKSHEEVCAVVTRIIKRHILVEKKDEVLVYHAEECAKKWSRILGRVRKNIFVKILIKLKLLSLD